MRSTWVWACLLAASELTLARPKTPQRGRALARRRVANHRRRHSNASFAAEVQSNSTPRKLIKQLRLIVLLSSYHTGRSNDQHIEGNHGIARHAADVFYTNACFNHK
jgi:hypothetical protein